MDLTEIRKLIPFYVAGTLTADERESVEREMKHSEELRNEIKFWTRTQHAVEANAAYLREGHLSTEQIVSLAEGKVRSGDRAKLETHVQHCEDCREELESIREIDTEAVPALDAGASLSELLRQFLRGIKLVYAAPAVALVALGIFIIVTRLSEPLKEENNGLVVVPPGIQKTHVSLSLFPVLQTRGQKSPTEPRLTLDSGTTHVDFALHVPHTSIPSIRYTASLLFPSGALRTVGQSLEAQAQSAELDSIVLSLPVDLFSRGRYHIILKEVLPPTPSGLTPEEHRFSFTVVPKPSRD